jgi:hypothetical protein
MDLHPEHLPGLTSPPAVQTRRSTSGSYPVYRRAVQTWRSTVDVVVTIVLSLAQLAVSLYSFMRSLTVIFPVTGANLQQGLLYQPGLHVLAGRHYGHVERHCRRTTDRYRRHSRHRNPPPSHVAMASLGPGARRRFVPRGPRHVLRRRPGLALMSGRCDRPGQFRPGKAVTTG